MAIGGESSGMALGSVECLTSGYDSWKCIVPTFVVQGEPCEETRVIPTMHHPRFYAAVTAKDYEVFVIGEYVCGHMHAGEQVHACSCATFERLHPLATSESLCSSYISLFLSIKQWKMGRIGIMLDNSLILIAMKTMQDQCICLLCVFLVAIF